MTKEEIIEKYIEASGKVLRLEIQLEEAKEEQTYWRRGIEERKGHVQTKKDYVLSIEERNMINNSKVIEAIKSLRNRTNLGLKEAKDIVDQYRGITY